MELRRYRTGDLEEIAELFYSTVHFVNLQDYSPEQVNAWATGQIDWEQWDRSLSEHYSVVAREEGMLVGFGDLDKTGYLDRLFVHKDFQGRGIASAICESLERQAGGPVTVHASITARPFFEKRGYRTVGEQQVKRGTVLLTNFEMEKRNAGGTEMKTVKRRHDIYSFEEEGVRSFLLLGKERVLAVDSGFGSFDLMAAVRELTELPLLCLNTHSDRDHTGGNASFSQVYAHEEEIPLLRERCPEAVEYVPLKEDDVLDLGGVEWKVIHCPGHTPGSIALLDEAGKLLISGDTVSEAPIYLFGEARDHQAYRETLKKLCGYQERVATILPSHGSCPLSGLGELAGDLMGTVDRFTSGQPEDQIVKLETSDGEQWVKLYRQGRGAIFLTKC